MADGRCAALLFQQLLNIAQRKRRAKLPPGRTEYEAGCSLRPFEDCGSGYYFAILPRHQPATLKVATHPSQGFKSVLGVAVPLFKCIRENKEWGPQRETPGRCSSPEFPAGRNCPSEAHPWRRSGRGTRRRRRSSCLHKARPALEGRTRGARLRRGVLSRSKSRHGSAAEILPCTHSDSTACLP